MMDITELEKLQQALDGALGIVREWQEKEEKQESPKAKWIVYLARPKDMDCYLDACIEEVWESAQKYYKAKTKLFIGTVNEVGKWYKARQKFAEFIKAWEDGRRIQFRVNDTYEWQDIPEGVTPQWFTNDGYRVKPEEEKKFRPYESSAEMIADFIDRFKVNCPPYCEPLIWVRLKVDKRKRLIVAYGDNFVEIGNKAKAVTLQHLFKQYEFLDGSPCGMEVKK